MHDKGSLKQILQEIAERMLFMKKKLVSAMLVLALLLTYTVSAMAGSTSTNPGMVDGYSCSGTATVTSYGGSATTHYAGSSAALSAKVVYRYEDGKGVLQTLEIRESNNGSSVTASRSLPSGAKRSYSAQGTHTVSKTDYWSGTTPTAYL